MVATSSICLNLKEQSTAFKQTGIVFDIQRAALHDGPGLRTVVFLKGCPLLCAWCHNPESQRMHPEVGKSGKLYGRQLTVAEVMTIVRSDCAYYAASGGGLTVSGGEPTVQFDFCSALMAAAKHEGIHTCLDTCGEFAPERAKDLLPLVDLWHFDYKATGTANHLRWTGSSGQRIQQNLTAILDAGAKVSLRCPIIPGANDSPDHHQAIGVLADSGRFVSVEKLPYHSIGNAKYSDLGRSEPEFRTVRAC